MIIYKQLLQTLSTIKTQKNKKDSRAESGANYEQLYCSGPGQKKTAAQEPEPVLLRPSQSPIQKLFVLFGPSRCDSRYHCQSEDHNDARMNEE